MSKPKTFIGQIFWDSKAASFSITRFWMILGNVFALFLTWDVRNIIVDAYYSGREIPDLEWYLIAVLGAYLNANLPYVSNRMSTRSNPYPSYLPEIPSESYQSVPDDDRPDIHSPTQP